MLTVITGQPGAGKTLYTLASVQALAEREGRTVHYSGIKDLRLPWAEMDDSTQWFKLPAGSIVVIDEAQRVFRQRSVGSVVPPHVAELETHRHKGFDIFLVTQHPKLLDANVRRLVGRHFHVVRNFGMNRATVHEWGELVADCETGSGRSESIRHEWGYPTEFFQAYQSAEVHTHKRSIPARVWLLLVLPFLFALLAYLAYRSIAGWVEKPHAVRALEARGDVGQQVEAARKSAGAVRAAPAVKAVTTADYLAARAPRVPALAHTAPLYDAVTAPVHAPYPAACVATASRCRCYSDQATWLDVPEALCRSIVQRGFFLEWEPKRAVARGDGGNGPHAKPGAKPDDASVGARDAPPIANLPFPAEPHGSDGEPVAARGRIAGPAPSVAAPAPAVGSAPPAGASRPGRDFY